MSVGDNFVNYFLLKIINKAFKAGVFPDMGVEDEDEERYVSELERRMTALDEKSVFITVRAIALNHPRTLVRTLNFMEQEGELK